MSEFSASITQSRNFQFDGRIDRVTVAVRIAGLSSTKVPNVHHNAGCSAIAPRVHDRPIGIFLISLSKLVDFRESRGTPIKVEADTSNERRGIGQRRRLDTLLGQFGLYEVIDWMTDNPLTRLGGSNEPMPFVGSTLFIQRFMVARCSGVSFLLDLGGGMTTSASSLVMRCQMSDCSVLPGTIAVGSVAVGSGAFKLCPATDAFAMFGVQSHGKRNNYRPIWPDISIETHRFCSNRPAVQVDRLPYESQVRQG